MSQVSQWHATSRSPEETYRWGRHLGALLRPGHWVLLEGPVGAGKTVFVQGVAAGLGVKDWVTSPTFTLVHHYGYENEGSGSRGDARSHSEGGGASADKSEDKTAGTVLVHADLYRLEDPGEAAALALDEAAAGAPVVVEWWRRAEDAFPRGRLEITLGRDGEGRAGDRWVRHMTCVATDEDHEALLEAWRRAVEEGSAAEATSTEATQQEQDDARPGH